MKRFLLLTIPMAFVQPLAAADDPPEAPAAPKEPPPPTPLHLAAKTTKAEMRARVFRAVKKQQEIKAGGASARWMIDSILPDGVCTGRQMFVTKKRDPETGETVNTDFFGDLRALRFAVGQAAPAEGEISEGLRWRRDGVHRTPDGEELPLFAAVGLFTKEEFVRRLKAGEAFLIRLPESKRCQRCRGFGKVSNPGGRSTGELTCPDCDGDGDSKLVIRYEVSW